jgi:D-alanyl-lipoteichoic acid acyltransferase DltB (MBOAT superfamily)
VPPHQPLEGTPVALGDEAPHQLAVGELAGTLPGESAQVPKKRPRLLVDHWGASGNGLVFFPLLLPRDVETAATVFRKILIIPGTQPQGNRQRPPPVEGNRAGLDSEGRAMYVRDRRTGRQAPAPTRWRHPSRLFIQDPLQVASRVAAGPPGGFRAPGQGSGRMLFNSLEFLVFFPVVTLLYFLLPHRCRWALLLAASCWFYMALIPAYILILVFTILVDYAAGLLIERARGRARGWYLGMSVAANVGLLAGFKYFNFVNENLAALAGFFHLPYAVPNTTWALPVGLSFHTFQAMSYTIEVYRGAQKAERSLGIYALYVLFYPQLVAGPIERPQNLLHQFRERHAVDYEGATEGLRRMAWGFFKKCVIADRLAVIVNAVFADPRRFTGPELTLATLAFTFQIYCDFSGYSDVALGAARVMGFRLMTNFRQPYFATSVGEFWRRWHVSLSTWFRDYVYVPLGGNRVSLPRRCLNLMAVFTLSGLWHGANWTFLAWGFLHGCYLVVALLWARLRGRPDAGPAREPAGLSRLLRGAVVFGLVSVGWVFFRANNLSDAFYVLAHLPRGWRTAWRDGLLGRLTAGVGVAGSELALAASAVALLLLVEAVQQRTGVGRLVARWPLPVRWAAYYAAVCGIILFGVFGHEQFIYFQF